MTPAYVDTSVVASWYVPDRLTTKALGLRALIALPVPLSALLQTEFVAALELKIFRGELSRLAADAVQATFDDDVRTGLYVRVPIDFDRIAQQAQALCRQHSARLGTRTLDLLHIAVALELGVPQFVTGDDRQAAAAEAAGLTVLRP